MASLSQSTGGRSLAPWLATSTGLSRVRTATFLCKKQRQAGLWAVLALIHLLRRNKLLFRSVQSPGGWTSVPLRHLLGKKDMLVSPWSHTLHSSVLSEAGAFLRSGHILKPNPQCSTERATALGLEMALEVSTGNACVSFTSFFLRNNGRMFSSAHEFYPHPEPRLFGDNGRLWLMA